jgi:hypothetical protein
VPTPKAVLGDIAGAPGILPYSHEVYRNMRLLEKTGPRVKVFSIGQTEEGREMIAVAVADQRLLAKLDENRARLAKLADPRTIHLDDAPPRSIELAYLLAVDESPYIKFIGENTITAHHNAAEPIACCHSTVHFREERSFLDRRLRGGRPRPAPRIADYAQLTAPERSQQRKTLAVAIRRSGIRRSD